MKLIYILVITSVRALPFQWNGRQREGLKHSYSITENLFSSYYTSFFKKDPKRGNSPAQKGLLFDDLMDQMRKTSDRLSSFGSNLKDPFDDDFFNFPKQNVNRFNRPQTKYSKKTLKDSTRNNTPLPVKQNPREKQNQPSRQSKPYINEAYSSPQLNKQSDDETSKSKQDSTKRTSQGDKLMENTDLQSETGQSKPQQTKYPKEVITKSTDINKDHVNNQSNMDQSMPKPSPKDDSIYKLPTPKETTQDSKPKSSIPEEKPDTPVPVLTPSKRKYDIPPKKIPDYQPPKFRVGKTKEEDIAICKETVDRYNNNQKEPDYSDCDGRYFDRYKKYADGIDNKKY